MHKVFEGRGRAFPKPCGASYKKAPGGAYPAGARMPERASGAVVESGLAIIGSDSFHQKTFQGFNIRVAGVKPLFGPAPEDVL
jgi:hypothetical protein